MWTDERIEKEALDVLRRSLPPIMKEVMNVLDTRIE